MTCTHFIICTIVILTLEKTDVLWFFVEMFAQIKYYFRVVERSFMNFNYLFSLNQSIIFQNHSYPESTKTDAFKQNLCVCQLLIISLPGLAR